MFMVYENFISSLAFRWVMLPLPIGAAIGFPEEEDPPSFDLERFMTFRRFFLFSLAI
jgi:hypothetical protein